jgi:hypothetical protein
LVQNRGRNEISFPPSLSLSEISLPYRSPLRSVTSPASLSEVALLRRPASGASRSGRFSLSLSPAYFLSLRRIRSSLRRSLSTAGLLCRPASLSGRVRLSPALSPAGLFFCIKYCITLASATQQENTLRRQIWQQMTGRRSSTLRRPDLAAKSARGRTPVKDGGGWPTAERKAAWREGDGDDRHRSERGREREGARRQIRAERGSERERDGGNEISFLPRF